MRKLILVAVAATFLGVPAAQAAPPPHLLFDFAGTGIPGFSGEGTPAGAAQLAFPNGVAVASDGRIAVADTANHRVRVIGRDGLIHTLAGTGTSGFSGDGGAPAAAQLNFPEGVAAKPGGGWLIADTANHVIREISADGNVITTVAGSGVRGFGGDLGPATAAQLDEPRAVAPTADGGFLIADSRNLRVRKVSAGGTITTVAGNGQQLAAGDGGPATAAGMSAYGVAAQPDGGFVIADADNSRVRRVDPDGMISTFAGTGVRASGGDGAPAARAQLERPYGVAVAPDGSVLVADVPAQRVRWIDPAANIHTLAGTGTPGYNGDGRDARLVQLDQPIAVAAGASGEVAVVERGNHRLRLVQAGLIPPPATPQPPQTAPPGAGNRRPQRLVAALARQRLRVRPRTRATLVYVLSDDARVVLELRRGGRRVARMSRSGHAGRNRITLRRLRRPGRYELGLTATTGDGRVSVDRGRLIVVR